MKNSIPRWGGGPAKRALQVALPLVLLGVSKAALADTTILDHLASSYQSRLLTTTGIFLDFAKRLFYLLATIELAWTFAVWALEKKEFESFWAGVVKKMMWLGCMLMLLRNGPTWIGYIVESFRSAGEQASGVNGLSPTEVFNLGLTNAGVMLSGMSNAGILNGDFLVMIVGGLSGIVMVVAFAILASQLLIALVESYIALSAGVIFLGFGGSRWTQDFVQKFIGYGVATGVKLMVLYLIVGIGNGEAASWGAMVSDAMANGAAGDKFNAILTVLAGSILYAYLGVQVPAIAASMLSGSPTLTAGGAAATAGAIGAGIVSAGALGASTAVGAAKSTGGLAAATLAAWNEAGAQGNTGLARAVSTLGNLGSAGQTVARASAQSSIGETVGGRMAAVSNANAAELGAASGPASVRHPSPPAPAPAPSGSADSSPASNVAPPATAQASTSGATPAPSAGQAAPATATPGGPAGSPAAAPTAAAGPAVPGTSTSGAAPAPDAGQAAPGGSAGTSPAAAAPATPEASISGTAPAPGAGQAAPGGSADSAPAAPNGTMTAAAPPASSEASAPSEVPAAPENSAISAPAVASPTTPATAANSIGGASSAPAPVTPNRPGLQDRLDEMRHVSPPQLPHDAAGGGTISIRLDTPHD